MFDISFKIEDENIQVHNMERRDILFTQIWINNESSEDLDEKIQINDLYERYLEYYISENEFFLKIDKNDRLIGIIKGRVEFKNPNIVWITFLLIDKQLRCKGLGSKIINEILQHFFNNYNIKRFYIALKDKDYKSLNFFEKNNFKIIRIVDEILNVHKKQKNMLILKRKL